MAFEIANAHEERKKLEQQLATQVTEGYERLISVKNDEDVDASLNFEDDDKALDDDNDENRGKRSNQAISPDYIGNVTVNTLAGDVLQEEENVETLKLIAQREKRPSKGDQSHEDTNGKKAEFASDWDLEDSETKPGRLGDETSAPQPKKSRWDDTPLTASAKVEFDYVDYWYFEALLKEEEEVQVQMSPDEQKEREVLKLLLELKSGTSAQRKTALTELTDKAREFGAGPLFNKIFPLLLHPTLEDQERRILVNLIDRLICKLDELVRPQAHKILVLIEPLLIDEDHDTRVQGRELISNLCKAVGLNTMIDAMRPDIDNIDEYVRNTTASAFGVVASTLGIPALLPFLKDVCQSNQSWRARYTGIKIVQQIAILMGCAALPHSKSLVEIIEHGLDDEIEEVRTITSLSLAALAVSSAPRDSLPDLTNKD